MNGGGISNRLMYFGTGEAVAMTLADMQRLYDESEEALSPAELACALMGYPEDSSFYAWDIASWLYSPAAMNGGECHE